MKTNTILLIIICLGAFINTVNSYDELQVIFSNFRETGYKNKELRDKDFDQNLFHKKVYIEIWDGADYEELSDFLKRNPILEEFSFLYDYADDPEMEDEEDYYGRLRAGEEYVIKRAFKDLQKLKKFTLISDKYTVQKVADRIRAFNEKMPNLDTLSFDDLTIDFGNKEGNVETLVAAIRKSRINLVFNNIRLFDYSYSDEHKAKFERRKQDILKALYDLYSQGKFTSNVFEIAFNINNRPNRKYVSLVGHDLSNADVILQILNLENAKEFNLYGAKNVAYSKIFKHILKNAESVAATNLEFSLDFLRNIKKGKITVSNFDFTGSKLNGNLENFLLKLKEFSVNKEKGVTIILKKNNLSAEQIALLDRLMNEDSFFNIITDAWDN